ncbi:MAG: RecX family transcriptional regulator [bacterium]|nr:RecX family transcriptional regulator [bacterium]MCP5039534.1 RecX family transcriptional regulator [bacterium]
MLEPSPGSSEVRPLDEAIPPPGAEIDAPGARSSQRAQRAQRGRKRICANTIERWATRHLERYPSSSENLRRVLARRIDRIERECDDRVPEATSWIEDAITRMTELGYLDDHRYARQVAEQMRGRGASALRIRHRLSEKGVPWEIGHAVLAGDDDEFEAAVRYARRRRLGPFRIDAEARADRRERDLAALGRSGFSYDVASRVIDATDIAHGT